MLETLDRERLWAIIDRFGTAVSNRREKEAMIRGIMADDTVELREVLGWLNRVELREICEGLGLDPSGKEKEGYVVRIIDHVGVVGTSKAAPSEAASEDEEDAPAPAIARRQKPKEPEVDVFIVHGHDDRMRLEIKRFLEMLQLKTVVLQDAPDRGMTILEKLEFYAMRARYAIVLLSPDDEGYSVRQGKEAAKSRARQNVILELGMMIGKLGRSRIAILHSGVQEKPSDIDGLVYIEYDPKHADAAFLKLARQLRTAEFAIDMNLLP